MAFGSIFCCVKGLDRKDREKKQSTWRVFSLKELHSATNNFNYDNKLGEGGFGSVYWGQLWDGSQVLLTIGTGLQENVNDIKTLLAFLFYFYETKYIRLDPTGVEVLPSNVYNVVSRHGLEPIAVKRLKVWSNKAEVEFSVEVEILARVRHKNLLSLRGYCAEGQERLIVYDYMPNLSLLSHLHGHHSAECLLDWKRRMSIAIGSAEGIAYLHHHATPHIIHRDVKASNVLLDSDFQPQVADFGFAKFIPDGATHVTTRVKGTLGYLAPEYAMLGKASESCDVYSFGILLLEIASGKKPLEKLNPTVKRSITEWALPLACEAKFNEVADPRLNGKYVEEELKRVVLVALICAHNRPEKRPTMLEVVDLLKGDAKEKFTELENDELFKSPPATNLDTEKSAPEGSPDVIKEDKEP